MQSILDDHELSCDILVAGGGPAGVPCALAAARNGAQVILCQDRHVLGGNASSEVRMHIVGADASGKRGIALQTEAREGGIIEEIRLETCVRNVHRSPSMLDLILYEKCRAEPNLTLMLNTRVTGVEMGEETNRERITHAIAERQSTEDRFRIAAQFFIDCTGDGQLGVSAGAPYRHGREGQDEYGESLAVPQADSKTLGSTLLFQGRKLDHPAPFVAPPWARTFSEDDLKLRPHASTGLEEGLEYGYWWLEWGGELDTIKDNETIRDELLSIMLGVWDHIKNSGDHGADNWVLDWFGFLPGKRESRRFVGQYTLCQQDLFDARPMYDAIAFGGWPIDTHPPQGIDAIDEAPCIQRLTPHIFDIPLRACVSVGPENLMFAGRNISATHIAFAATRVMATCAAVGQGVGTAAAYAVQHHLTPANLTQNKEAIHAIQQRLLRDDAFLIGRVNQDEQDIARTAQVTASSQQIDGPAGNVLSGQTRSVHGEKGAKLERANPGSHRWMSDPSTGLPAWIELRWDNVITIGTIELIFDTGMHRPLTLTQADSYVERMIWGRAQPETVKAYTIEGRTDDDDDDCWRLIAQETDNHQRRRVHTLSADQLCEVNALRITVLATHGLDHARLCEVRVYTPGAEQWSQIDTSR